VKLIQKHGMVPKMYGNVHGDYPLFQTYTNLTAVRMFFLDFLIVQSLRIRCSHGLFKHAWMGIR
jgi:hypothetical protein